MAKGNGLGIATEVAPLRFLPIARQKPSRILDTIVEEESESMELSDQPPPSPLSALLLHCQLSCSLSLMELEVSFLAHGFPLLVKPW